MTAATAKRGKSRKAYLLPMRIPYDWVDAAEDIDADMTPAELFRDILHPILRGDINIIRNHAGEVTGFVPSPHRKRRHVSDVPRPGRPKNATVGQPKGNATHARAHKKSR